MGDEQQDAEAAIETLAHLAMEAQSMRQEIPARILFNRTKKISKKTKLAASINKQVRTRLGSFTPELRDLPAFSWLHYLGGTLCELDSRKVVKLPKAIACAEAFAEEVLQVLSLAEADAIGANEESPLS